MIKKYTFILRLFLKISSGLTNANNYKGNAEAVTNNILERAKKIGQDIQDSTDIKERFNSHKYYSNINKSKLYNFINENGTPSYGVFFYIIGDNYGDTNITMTTWCNAGGSGLRLYNTYVPPGFNYALASTGAQTFTVRAGFPSGYYKSNSITKYSNIC